MKKLVFVLMIISGMLILNFSCKNSTGTNRKEQAAEKSELGTSLIVVAKDIISEIIVKPDSLGDPWEIEKVKSYNGKQMFTTLFKNIYNKKVTVYDNLTGNALDPEEVRKMENEIGSDLSKIAKIQFLEDWFYDPAANKIIKKLKSVSFGYEYQKEKDGPVRYKALFKMDHQE